MPAMRAANAVAAVREVKSRSSRALASWRWNGIAEPQPKLLPDALVGPLQRVVAGPVLEVEAAGCGSAGELGGEPVPADAQQRVPGRGHVGEERDPADAVVGAVRGQRGGWDGGPADAVVTVAARDVPAPHLPPRSGLVPIGDRRLGADEVVQDDVGHVEPQVSSPVEEHLDQSPQQNLLRDKPSGPAVGKRGDVDEPRDALVPKLQVRLPACVGQDPVGETVLDEDLPGRVVEHADPLAAFDVGAAARLQHHTVHIGPLQQAGQGQSGRSGPDDDHSGIAVSGMRHNTHLGEGPRFRRRLSSSPCPTTPGSVRTMAAPAWCSTATPAWPTSHGPNS
ncbi:hypothetical protein Vau01_050670 [Virgisporangium aurantiacum]|uniref:Uncharacterized protein n=1 Tax=Virgisporangium aurantiacum TaxID=175570 RepID=A0A8J4E171_9ACTN|nr:hypothetical protein Vau01_050670 [Virgisporangium aurantiacum]